MSISYATSSFGNVTFNGDTYTLKDQAEPTNRVFAGWSGDAGQGETYTSEWAANATGPDGASYQIIWQFEQTKGDEQEPDTLDWDDVHSVKLQ